MAARATIGLGLGLALLAARSASAARLSHDDILALYGRTPAPAAPVTLRVPRDAAQSLRDAAVAKGIFIGTAINVAGITTEPIYATIAKREFSLTTAENECKPVSTEPQQGVFTLDQCKQLAVFTASTNASFRNHNLCWNSQNPQWLTNPKQPWTAAQLQSILQVHVNGIISAFSAPAGTPDSYCYDVVNEAVIDNNSPTPIFKNANPWFPTLPNYVADAFVYARKVNSSAKLFYNDYGGEGSGVKSDKIYNMVAGFVAGGTPIDGVGLQMHISVDGYPTPQSISDNIKRLVALGLEVHITEMDVRCSGCTADRLALQAKIYGDILQVCLDNSKPTNPNGKGGCKSFEVWGFTDKHTWIGEQEAPLLYDANYVEKPAYFEVLAVLQAA